MAFSLYFTAYSEIASSSPGSTRNAGSGARIRDVARSGFAPAGNAPDTSSCSQGVVLQWQMADPLAFAAKIALSTAGAVRA